MGKISFKRLCEDAKLPERMTDGAAGFDLYNINKEKVTLKPGQTRLFPTGLSIAMPKTVCALIIPRSGLALKHGITVANAPGLIDSDYRGEMSVILANIGTQDYTIENGDRIAQLLFVGAITGEEGIEFVETDTLSTTDRGSGGFGSTG